MIHRVNSAQPNSETELGGLLRGRMLNIYIILAALFMLLNIPPPGRARVGFLYVSLEELHCTFNLDGLLGCWKEECLTCLEGCGVAF